MQFKELFGFDFIRDFNGTPNELKHATSFYEEFLQYRDDKEPGEEYELVFHWAEDLNLDKFFELVDENEFRTKRTNIDNLLTSIEKDPFGFSTNDPERDRDMKKFIQKHSNTDTNPAVIMYMVDALQFFKGMDHERIKKIAYDIAFLGTQGINPANENYTIASIPGKTFSGYNLLAYYYVSWTLAVPELLHQLNLPFNKEYDIAIQLFNLPQ